MKNQPDIENLQRALQESRKRQKKPVRNRVWRNIGLFFIGMLLVIIPCLSPYCKPYRIQGDAMYPTLRKGDCVMLARRSSDVVKRNAIVLFPSPEDNQRLIARRVVAVAGDIIEVRDERLWRNGKITDEPWILEMIKYKWGPVTCPQDAVFVLGDNRNHCEDSFTWQKEGKTPAVPVEQIRGRIYMVFYPFNRMKFIK